ncbi:hypothetical protein H4582DRAFT_322971 [Lactarius indigo]|nr:hypothetical protein H4582DRAFT_322971 [Lactarius indigo]
MHDPDLKYGKVLLLSTEDSTLRRIKYYACHEARCLFWLDVYDANCMVSEVFCITSPARVKHRLEGLYWAHYYLFPAVFNGCCLQPAVYDELLGILSHGCMGKHVYLAVPSRQNSMIGTTDILTSKSSTLSYDDDTIQKMVNLVRKVKEPDAGGVPHCRRYPSPVLFRILEISEYPRTAARPIIQEPGSLF